MKGCPNWIFSVLITAICPAAEIAAWKVPLEKYAYRGLETDGVVRCEAAPEASPFFKPGDELWDLSGIPLISKEHKEFPPLDYYNQRLDTDPPLEWVIWNASSGRLVSKGEWSCIWQLHGRLEIDQLPRLCRLTAEIFTVPADGGPLSKDSTPVSSLSWICRSGNMFDASVDDDPWSIKVDGSVDLDIDTTFASLQLNAAFGATGQDRVEFRTAATLQSGKPLWLARDSTISTGMDFRISSRVELVDGTPIEEVLLIQKDMRAEPIKADKSEMRRFEIKGKGWLATLWLDPSEAAGFSGEEPPDQDPFAEPGPHEPMREQFRWKEIEVPEPIKPWFGRKVWDFRDAMIRSGVLDHTSTAFSGYDRLTQRIFLYSDRLEDFDRFEFLFSGVCIRLPKYLVVTLDGNGQSRLLTRSGQKAHLSRSMDSGKIIRSMDIEPTNLENDTLIDLRIDYNENSDPSPVRSINTSVTLYNAITLELLSGKTSDTAEVPPLRVKAEIMELHD